MPNRYYVNIDASDVRFSLKINGVQIASLDKGERFITEKPISLWVAADKNIFSVDLISLPEEDVVRGKLHVEIFLHDETSEHPKAKKTYLSYGYPHPKIGEVKNTFSESVGFQVKELVPTKVWTDSEIVNELSKADKVEIFELLTAFSERVINKDIDGLVKYLDYKVHDEARVNGVDFSASLNIAKRNFSVLSKYAGLGKEPFKLEDIEFSIVGEGRLVYVKNISGKVLLRFALGGNFLDIPVYVAMIKGKWAIVR